MNFCVNSFIQSVKMTADLAPAAKVVSDVAVSTVHVVSDALVSTSEVVSTSLNNATQELGEFAAEMQNPAPEASSEENASSACTAANISV